MQTTNQRTIIDGKHTNVDGLSFLLLAVTVNGIIGRSSPSYPGSSEVNPAAHTGKTAAQGLPIVGHRDSEYYYYEENEDAEAVENDFSLLFGPPPPRTTTLTTTSTESITSSAQLSRTIQYSTTEQNIQHPMEHPPKVKLGNVNSMPTLL